MLLESYSQCTLCPRECKVNRNQGELGYCGRSANLYVARAALHMWEEPCISGYGEEEDSSKRKTEEKNGGKKENEVEVRGSGAVFFAGCSMRCVFCQNGDISGREGGTMISVDRLSQIFLELEKKGAANINLVTPTHYAPSIKEAVKTARKLGCHLPVIYNSSGYEKVSTLQMLEGSIDVYLPDFKYKDAGLAKRYSNAPDYFKVASKAIEEMVRQTGSVKINNETGFIEKGVIVRHLVLPGCVEDSKEVIRYLHETYGDKICISIMSQYTPMSSLEQYPELNRKVSQKEYDEVVDYAISIGVENGFIQEGDTVGESFIPAFDGEGVNQVIPLKVPYEKFHCKKDGFVATLTAIEEQEMTEDRKADEKRPAVIVCPGGAYFFKCDREGMPVAKAFARAGAAAFLLDYSVTPNRFPAALLEVARSVQYVREHAQEYRVNPDNIIVCGFSAGGHLAACLGAMWQQPFLWQALETTKEMIRPDGIIPCYPVITTGEYTHVDSCVNLVGYENCGDLVTGYTLNQDMERTQNCWAEREKEELKKSYDKLLAQCEYYDNGVHYESASILQLVSLEKQVTSMMPPTFIWTTFDDDLVPMENSLLLVKAMRKQNVPVEFHLFPHGIHGLSLATEDISLMPDGSDVSQTVQAWFAMAWRWIESLK